MEHVIAESPWKRTRVFLLSENEAAILIEGRQDGGQAWDQVQGYILSRDACSSAHILFQDFDEKGGVP